MTKVDVINEECLLSQGLARPAVRALNGVGRTSLSQLATTGETELKALYGMDSNVIATGYEALSKEEMK